MTDALTSPVVTPLRQAVPEFEPAFQEVFEDEDRELGSFQAVSTFAEWLLSRLRRDASAPEVARSFEAVERLALAANARSVQLGSDLLREFLDLIRDQPGAVGRLGPVSRSWLNA